MTEEKLKEINGLQAFIGVLESKLKCLEKLETALRDGEPCSIKLGKLGSLQSISPSVINFILTPGKKEIKMHLKEAKAKFDNF